MPDPAVRAPAPHRGESLTHVLSLQGGTSTADVHLQDGEQWHTGKRGDIATPLRGPGQHGSSKSASIISEWEVYILLAQWFLCGL